MGEPDELKAAFAAYNDNIMTNRQVTLCHDAIVQVNKTLFAMGEKGCHLLGYIMAEHSLERIRQLRSEDRAALTLCEQEGGGRD